MLTPDNAIEYITIGTVETITNANTLVLSSSYTDNTLNAATAYIDKRINIKNEEQYHESFEGGATSVGQFAAKYPGKLGNSIQVVLLDHNTFKLFNGTGTLSGSSASSTITVSGLPNEGYLQPGYTLYTETGNQIGVIKKVLSKTSIVLVSPPTITLTSAKYKASIPSELSSLFTRAPGTSLFAENKGYESALDEVHVIVLDAGGKITGTPNAVLEKYSFLSKMQDALDESGSTIYYKNKINSESKYVWWLDTPSTDEVDSTGVSWGTDLISYPRTSVVQPLKCPNFVVLDGGFDASSTRSTLVVQSDKIAALQILSNKELYTFQSIFVGKAAPEVANAAISLAELRQDAVVFISPEDVDGSPIKGTGTSAVNKILNYRALVGKSSSYAFMDSGYKEQLDKYNVKKIAVPLNGDIAGLNAAATRIQPWNTPAGFNHGQLKNTVKLLFNPTEPDRDLLYPMGVNSVVAFKAHGTVLFGDKTMQDRASAFDRIEVRNLFIFLEKSIEKFAQSNLFEINDAFTRAQFKNTIEPFLRTVKGNRGIYDFQIICDETNNTPSIVETNTFVADLKIKPNYNINFLNLNFVGTRQSASFTTTV
jgi:hypothetical protein